MQLFAKRGFDHVTVAEVAAAADVSEKTVYNYFPTKEDLFFDEVPAREAALVAAITGRREGVSILGALRRLQAGECPRLCSPGSATWNDRSVTVRQSTRHKTARLPQTHRSTAAWPWNTDVAAGTDLRGRG